MSGPLLSEGRPVVSQMGLEIQNLVSHVDGQTNGCMVSSCHRLQAVRTPQPSVRDRRSHAGNTLAVKCKSSSSFAPLPRKMNIESELQQLVGEIKRLGVTAPDGSTTVSFGKLVNDERVSQICEPPLSSPRHARLGIS